MNGIVVIDKEKGLTSRDVVNKVGKILNTKKVGHTGTLDPLATGVLVICVGKATKLVELITSYDKEYIATFKFGVLTDTLDTEGTILKEEDVSLTKEQIIEAVNSMTGTYMQEVPIYSAVKVNGMKLYEYARKGIEVELPKHEVTIHDLEVIDYFIDNNRPCIKVKCHVSKGTYIRSLGYDIAKRLNTCAIMTDLRRTKQGVFTLDDAIKIETLSSDTKLLSILDSLKNYYQYEIDDSLKEDILNGKILDNKYGNSEVLFVYKGEAVALYKEYEEDKTKIKPWKMFMTRV